RGYQDHFMDGGDARGDVHDARIDLAGLAVDALQPRNLVLVGKRGDGIGRQIEAVTRLRVPGADAPITPLHGDRASRARGFLQSGQDDLIGVGEACLLTRERAYTHTLLDARTPVLHDAVLERPGFLARELEVEIGEVDGVREHLAEDAVEAAVIETARPEDEIAGERQRVGSGGSQVCHDWPLAGIHDGRSVQYAMGEGREAGAITPLPLEIDVGRDAAAAPRQAVEHPPPVIDDHAVAVGLAPVRVKSRLRGGEHEAEILDGPRPQQRLPVCTSRRFGEGGRDHQQLRPRSSQAAKELRKADVVAHGESQAAHRGLYHYGRGSGGDVRRLAIAVGFLALRNLHIEQVNLVVPRPPLSLRVIDQGCGSDAAVARAAQRYGAAHDPDPGSQRCLREEVLYRAVAVVFGDA